MNDSFGGGSDIYPGQPVLSPDGATLYVPIEGGAVDVYQVRRSNIAAL
jgi:hypothetical protein